MQLVVDPRLLVALVEHCSRCACAAKKLLSAHKDDELLITPLSCLSLSPLFPSGQAQRDAFFAEWRISVATTIPVSVMHTAYRAWRAYQSVQTDERGAKRVFDALYAGAFSLGCDGLLTLGPDLYEAHLKGVKPVGS